MEAKLISLKRFTAEQKEKEKGAIIVEATIALTAYIFAILILLSVVDICYVQAKMGTALNAAAKEMSQYSYLYTALNMQDYMSGEGGKSSEILESFSEVLSTLSKDTAYISDELSGMFDTASNAAGNDSIADMAKDGLGRTLAKQLVKKNLISYEGDTPEAFLKRNHVVNGINGLNFSYTSFLTDVDQNEVDLIVTYEVQVVRLLNIDVKFKFNQRAHTKAWETGICQIEDSSSDKQDESVWSAGNLSRGNKIISSEKKNFAYTSSSDKFHAYDPDKNEFIKIRSINTFDDTYAKDSQNAIKNSLSSSFNSLYGGVENIGSTVTVKDSSGNSKTFTSNKETRTYRIVLVVPDDADMQTVNAAAKAFEKEKASLGYKVTIDVKTGYGNAAPKTEKESGQEKDGQG